LNTGKWLQFVVGAVAAAALLLSVHAHRELARVEAIAPTAIASIAALVAAREDLLLELQSPPFAEPGHGALDAFLMRIRRDGVPKHVEMKRRLDALADNATALQTLINLYAPRARTTAFSAELPALQQYVTVWHERWNSVMELYMAGGNLPAADPVWPKSFRQAIEIEQGTN